MSCYCRPRQHNTVKEIVEVVVLVAVFVLMFLAGKHIGRRDALAEVSTQIALANIEVAKKIATRTPEMATNYVNAGPYFGPAPQVVLTTNFTTTNPSITQ